MVNSLSLTATFTVIIGKEYVTCDLFHWQYSNFNEHVFRKGKSPVGDQKTTYMSYARLMCCSSFRVARFSYVLAHFGKNKKPMPLIEELTLLINFLVIRCVGV